MNTGPQLTSFAPPEGVLASLGAARREVMSPQLTSFAPPEGVLASLGAARREAA
jgi:hypothetical protein